MSSKRGIRSWDPTYTLRRSCRAYVHFSADIWMRSVKIAASYAWLSVDRTTSPKSELSTRGLFTSFIFALQNYWIEMATIIPLAIEGLANGEFGEGGISDEFGRPLDLTSPRKKMFSVGDKPVMLPARIADASQGWALYFVAADLAQDELIKREKEFTVIDVGLGRTPVVIFGIDHRQSDLGKYQEIGVALFVRPRHNPLELPGIFFLSLVVSDQFTIDASRIIWGYQKSLAKHMTVKYSANSSEFWIDDRDPTTLSVSFPQFGRSRSTDIPCYIYSVSGSDNNKVVQRTMLSRSAIEEGIQIDGEVKVQLGKGSEKNCVCRGSAVREPDCICSILRGLQIPERPAANGWAQSMSGSFGPPSPCA
jgi:Acetoacetate decarboxylase (ADC)